MSVYLSICMFVCLSIYLEDLYSTPSRELLGGAPSPRPGMDKCSGGPTGRMKEMNVSLGGIVLYCIYGFFKHFL